MKKIVKLTESDLTRIVKKVIKEQESEKETAKEITKSAKSAVEDLSSEEKNILADFIKNNDPEDVMNVFKQQLSSSKTEMSEEEDVDTSDLGMSSSEFKTRKIIDKIINSVAFLGSFGIVPAAMFISGGAAFGLGLAGLAAYLLKDAAWYSKHDTSGQMPGSGIRPTGINYKAADRARK